MNTNSEDTFHSAFSPAVCTSLLWIACAMTAAVSAISNACQVQMLRAVSSGQALPRSLAETQDFWNWWLAALVLSTGIAAQISFLLWLYRASRNARALGALEMTFTPGWSIGWFFVPGANLVMPYLVLRELWQVSSPQSVRPWRAGPASPLVVVWWWLCVAAMVIHYSPLQVLFGMRLTEISSWNSDLRVDSLSRLFFGRLVSDIVAIACSVLTVVVVMCITDMQERRRGVADALILQESDTSGHLSESDRAMNDRGTAMLLQRL